MIEIVDAPGRRVQARIPASRLTRVAGLAVVDFIRLPSYGVTRRVGAVLTEGDAIHAADVARAQFGVNGTGVKVGVISDGIRGIFATKCLTCEGVSGGPIASRDLPDATGTRDGSGTLTAASGGIIARSAKAERRPRGSPVALQHLRVPGRRRRRHGAPRSRARSRARRATGVRERRHRTRVQQRRQLTCGLERRRRGRSRVLRRAGRWHRADLEQHRERAQQPRESHSRVHHVGRQRRRRSLHRDVCRLARRRPIDQRRRQLRPSSSLSADERDLRRARARRPAARRARSCRRTAKSSSCSTGTTRWDDRQTTTICISCGRPPARWSREARIHSAARRTRSSSSTT